jgi:hypothetical protein
MILNKLNFSKNFFGHLLFWFFVWLFFRYFFEYSSNENVYGALFSTLLLPVTIIITYFVSYFLIPKYLLQKKYFKFWLYSLYTLIVSADIIVIIIALYFLYFSNNSLLRMPFMSKQFVFVLVMVYLVVGLVSFMNLLNQNFKTISKNKELQNKILETQLQIKNQELQYLKKQIHPHFLFNTLNTIYGFALKQSKNTPEIILKLSNLLDYILYQVNKPKVSLVEEVLHIKEYIELEKIRFQDTLKVNFVSNAISNKVEVAPMLLIPFVENAFKHGIIINGFLTVEGKVEFNKNVLNFTIKNTISKVYEDLNENGIGLENIKKRLDLLYKNNYKLQVTKENGWFEVNLRIFNLNN